MKALTWLAVAALGLVATVVGHRLGLATAPDKGPGVVAGPGLEAGIGAATATGANPPAAATREARPGRVRDPDEIHRLLKKTLEDLEAARQGDELALGRAEAAVASLSPGEIPAALEFAERLWPGAEKQFMLRRLIDLLAQTAPAAAVDYCVDRGHTDPHLMGPAFHRWAERDGRAAYARLTEFNDGSFEKNKTAWKIYSGVFREWALQDFDAVVAKADSARDWMERRGVIRGLAELFREDGAAQARLLEAVDAMPDSGTRTELVHDIAGLGARTHREFTMRWLDSLDLTEPQRHEAQRQFARNWFYDEERAAVDWLFSVQPDSERAANVEMFTRYWANSDRDAWMRWMTTEIGMTEAEAEALHEQVRSPGRRSAASP